MSHTVSTMTRLLNEYFATGFLSPAESAKYYLICRYRHQVSRRLKDERQALYEKGKKASDEWFKKELMRPLSETLFGLLPKDAGAFGATVPIPLEYMKD